MPKTFLHPNETNLLTYLRGRWPEDPIPEGCPVWLLYEVDAAQDVVLRSVELFADDRSERNSIELEARDGFPCVSVCHGPFIAAAIEAKLEPVTAEEFEALWQRSVDKPLD